jgi:MerR family redox-sensitive transcriptional activator SoxR
MTIGALAAQAGIRPSAIRYYERLGLLPAPLRQSGRRSYDPDAVAQLAIVQCAMSAGFTVRDARQLVRGFSVTTPVGSRWRQLADAKLKELDHVIDRAQAMQALLRRLAATCHCDTLTDCGRRLARNRARWSIERRRLT